MKTDTRRYPLRPFVVTAERAHAEKLVMYNRDGTATVHYEDGVTGESRVATVSPAGQFPLILPSLQDLNKALSQTANSPLTGGASLRERFDAEMAAYEALLEEGMANADTELPFPEPDYGTYVYDQLYNQLFLILPEFWHRLGLVTNNGKLCTDPGGTRSWAEIRAVFDAATVGVVGASVGGNLAEGIMREVRPKQMKIADYDWVELTNLNRFERGSLRHLGASKAARFDTGNPYDITRISKAAITAYEHHMTDPYAEWFVYGEGLHTDNLDRFLLGHGDEPRIDLLVEECDDLRLKVELRKRCRAHKIPVLMLSDFGHRVQVQMHDYKRSPDALLGYDATDDEVEQLLETAMTSGKREDRFAFVKALCGPDFAADEFGDWVEARGEQPTSSLPQSGATAMSSGGIGGKLVALYLLGHEIPERTIYDLKNARVAVG